MKTQRFTRPCGNGNLVLLTITTAAALMTAGLVMGQEAPAEPAGPSRVVKAAPAAAAPAEVKKFRGRLPMYYGQVVDEKQRQAVYAIQKEYFAEIEALKAKLEALTKDRDAKVAAVLTPEQVAKIAQTRAAAKAKRDAKKKATAGS